MLQDTLDEAARLAYADWLEEQGRAQEAQRARSRPRPPGEPRHVEEDAPLCEDYAFGDGDSYGESNHGEGDGEGYGFGFRHFYPQTNQWGEGHGDGICSPEEAGLRKIEPPHESE